MVELFQALEEAIAATEESLAAAEELKRALLRELLEPRNDWNTVRLDEIAEVIGGRQRSPSKMTGQYTTPYLRAANVSAGAIDFADVLSMDFTPQEREKYTLRSGDVVLVEGNASLQNVGACAIYTSDMPDGFCIQNTLIRVRTRNREVLDADFLYLYLSNLHRNGTFAELATGTNIKHLGSTRVAKVCIALPSLTEQRKICEVLTAASEQYQSLVDHKNHLESLKAQAINRLLTGQHDAARAGVEAAIV
jgi:type I restriction enzyme S subunit